MGSLNALLILASASPRRRQFLALLGLPFQIRVADVDERNGKGESSEALVARLSLAKAQAVAASCPHAIVVGADTVVTLDGAILGKPAGRRDAAAMLRRLRGRSHEVYSGVSVCQPNAGKPLTTVVKSTVWMRRYSDAEIAAYVASGDPLDKAGAYGIQHAGFHPVARLQGCYASVMGLPVAHLARLLAQAGIQPPVDVRAACRTLTGVPCCGGDDQVLNLD
jgi:septum formation protein